MENIWNEAQEKVHNGSTFRINLEKRNLVIDGKYVIKEGQYEGCLGIESGMSIESTVAAIEKYYLQYYRSVPSARSEARYKHYFRALPEHQLSEDDMLYGESREVAQLRLELYVLIAILNNDLRWGDLAKDKWFWQSENIPSLIILQQWIISNYQS